MAQDQTPEIIEVAGERVYKVASGLNVGCTYCPYKSVVECMGKFGIEIPCGNGFFFVREDVWHKIKLRNS